MEWRTLGEQGQSSPLSLRLTQTGTAVSATLSLDGLEVEGGGAIGEDDLSLSSTYMIASEATVSVSRMQGTIFALFWRKRCQSRVAVKSPGSNALCVIEA